MRSPTFRSLAIVATAVVSGAVMVDGWEGRARAAKFHRFDFFERSASGGRSLISYQKSRTCTAHVSTDDVLELIAGARALAQLSSRQRATIQATVPATSTPLHSPTVTRTRLARLPPDRQFWRDPVVACAFSASRSRTVAVVLTGGTSDSDSKLPDSAFRGPSALGSAKHLA